MRIRIRVKPEWVQAILLGLGTVAGAVTFWYKDIYQPAATPATLTITPALEMIGRRGDDLLMRASVKVENRSGYRVYVPAFWYTIRGLCHRTRALSADSYATALRGWRDGGVQSRFNERASGELLVAGRPSPRVDSYFDPGSERRYEELFVVPDGPYSALQMKVDYMVAKEITEIAATRWVMEPNGEVADAVFLNRRHVVRARNGLAWTTTTRVERYSRVAHQDWARRARAGWGWSQATLSLWPASADPRRPSGTGVAC